MIAPQTPGDRIKAELEARGWTQSDLAKIIDRPPQSLNQIIAGNKAITPETAVQLGVAFGTGAEVWLQLESQYRLSLADIPTENVARRAKLYSLAPIKELQNRGWIRTGDDLTGVEHDLLKLFEITSLDEEPGLQAAMMKSVPEAALTPAQKAWCFRVRQLAKSYLVSEYDESRLPKCERELRKLAAYSQETRKVPDVLSSYGIRFVVIQPLAGSKVDGMATWLDEKSPVIGMSLRYDRIDNFWHALFHEWSHIRHRDLVSVDIDDDITEPESLHLHVKPPIERRANAEAANSLIPSEEMESFVRRISPLYSKERINQLANRLKIHPGIIVGQLQRRGEIGWSSNREMLTKIRHFVTPVALTDGWGNSIDQRTLG